MYPALSIRYLAGPVAVGVRLPDGVSVIHDDGVIDTECRHRVLDAVQFFREREFRGMYADDDEAVWRVAAVPFGDVRERSNTVDGVVPEINQDHLVAEFEMLSGSLLT